LGSVTQSTVRPRVSSGGRAPTLWEEGDRPGRQVVAGAASVAVVVAAANVALTGRLSLFYDLTFAVVCLVAALAVRPRDFFPVAVLPPLLMLGTVLALALVKRSAVADATDGLVQAVVSGLAHHAAALALGYAAALIVLAVRQVALRSRLG